MSLKPNQLSDRDHIPEEFTAEDLAEHGFTDAEIEALRRGDENDPALIAAAAEGQSGAEGGEDDEAAEVGAPPAEVESQAQEQENAPGDERLPKIEVPDTSEAEKIVAELDAKLEALSTAYDDGEITAAEMRERTKALIAEQAKAQMEIEQARETIEGAEKTIHQRFFDAQDAYYKAGADGLMSAEHVKDWDRHLRDVTGNPAYANLTMRQWIELAHRRYADEYQVIHGKPLPIAIPTPAQAKPKLEVRDDQRPEPVQTLSSVNGDDSDAVRDSRAAQLDRTAQEDPLAAEAMLDRMSPGEEENYLRYA